TAAPRFCDFASACGVRAEASQVTGSSPVAEAALFAAACSRVLAAPPAKPQGRQATRHNKRRRTPRTPRLRPAIRINAIRKKDPRPSAQIRVKKSVGLRLGLECAEIADDAVGAVGLA